MDDAAIAWTRRNADALREAVESAGSRVDVVQADARTCAGDGGPLSGLRAKAAVWLPGIKVQDSGVEAPDPAVILALLADIPADRLGPWTQAEPLTDTSAFFHAGTPQ